MQRVKNTGEIKVFAREVLRPGDAEPHIFYASRFCLSSRLNDRRFVEIECVDF